MAEREPWSWKRWFGGFIEGGRYGKDAAILLRMAVILAVVALVAFGVIHAKERLFGKATGGSSHQAGPSTIEGNAGTVTQTDDHATYNYTITEYPFAKGILGWIFGPNGIFDHKTPAKPTPTQLPAAVDTQ